MADNEEVISWSSEVIPPSDLLYMRVHRQFTANGDCTVGAFRDQGTAMSTEWERYSTPLESQSRARSPSDNSIVEMVTSDVLAIEGLSVTHTPDLERRVRAHIDVAGKKTPEVRVKLKRISRWAIPIKAG